MFILSVSEKFSSAHRLRNYNGRCENLHGHNWKVEIKISGKDLDKTGMLYDFTKLKSILKNILTELDHKYLNELPVFKKNNPTSENIAKYIYDQICSEISNSKIKIESVTVWESDNSSATFLPCKNKIL